VIEEAAWFPVALVDKGVHCCIPVHVIHFTLNLNGGREITERVKLLKQGLNKYFPVGRRNVVRKYPLNMSDIGFYCYWLARPPE
jgi:hypothetical protein